jgi:hypothetical protein
LLNITGKEVLKEKMKNSFFSLKPLSILNPMKGIKACDAGILSNQASFALRARLHSSGNDKR